MDTEVDVKLAEFNARLGQVKDNTVNIDVDEKSENFIKIYCMKKRA